MSSVSSAGGGTSAKGLSSGYNPAYHYNEDYDDTEEPSCKKYTTTNNQPIKIKGGDVKAEDSDTDDSDEELGNMIYESSRTAKKFREQEAAERITESESHEGNTKSERESPTTIDNNECTNTDVQGAAPKQGMRQFHQNIQLDLNRMHHQHHYQHHPTPATESLLQNNWQQMLKSRMNGECTNDNNERTNTVVQGGEPRQGRRQIKEKYPDGTLHIPGMSGAGENRTMHHHQHRPPQPVGPSPQPQYQYPGGYHLQTYVQPFQHQHQQYLYVTTYAVPPGYTVLQPPVPDSLEPKNTSGGSSSSSTNGDGTSAASSSNTKLKRKKKFSPSSATAKRPSHSTCRHDGCTNIAHCRGACTRHGAMLECSREGCTNIAVIGGVCMGHGASKKICSHEGCTNHVKRSGVCWRHGAKRTLPSCRHEGCTNHAKKGGVCIRHGAKIKNKTCNHEGCTNQVVKGGVCWRHGAKQECSYRGCSNNALKAGVFCRRHGAKVKVKK